MFWVYKKVWAKNKMSRACSSFQKALFFEPSFSKHVAQEPNFEPSLDLTHLYFFCSCVVSSFVRARSLLVLILLIFTRLELVSFSSAAEFILWTRYSTSPELYFSSLPLRGAPCLKISKKETKSCKGQCVLSKTMRIIF